MAKSYVKREPEMVSTFGKADECKSWKTKLSHIFPTSKMELQQKRKEVDTVTWILNGRRKLRRTKIEPFFK